MATAKYSIIFHIVSILHYNVLKDMTHVTHNVTDSVFFDVEVLWVPRVVNDVTSAP